MKTDGAISIAVKVTYADAGGQLYETTICLLRLGSGAVAFGSDEEKCQNNMK